MKNEYGKLLTTLAFCTGMLVSVGVAEQNKYYTKIQETISENIAEIPKKFSLQDILNKTSEKII